MMEQFEQAGHWWLPSQPDDQISGTVKYRPLEGISLELIGSFRELGDTDRVREEDIILGVTLGGKAVTLYKCFESRTRFVIGTDLSTSSYVAQVVFSGHHFEKVTDVVFSSYSVEYSFLEEWAGITGFSVELQDDATGKLTKHIVSYSFPEEICVNVDEFKLAISYRFTSAGTRIKDVLLKHITFFKIESAHSISFEVFLNRINFLLQNFLSFGLGRATRPVSITANNENAKYKLPDGKAIYQDIEIYYAVNDLPDISKDFRPFDMLFGLRDINAAFERCLNNWFSKETILRPVYDLYFATLNKNSMYLTHEFLNLVQALETYHRRVIGGHYIGDSDYAALQTALVSSIPGGIDADYRKSLTQKFRYLNEYSLRKRLHELLKRTDSVFKNIVKNGENFVDNVVSTRNYFTHFDSALESKILTGSALYWATRKLRALLEICLLVELGITTGEVEILFNRNEKLRFLRQK